MQIGDKVGRYTLERPLGEGGMGAVFLAYDPQTEARVVLKLLPADLTSPEMEARFRREIKSIAQLDHPNAVRVLDFTVSKDACFYTMPHIPAMDLSRYSKILQGPDSVPPASSFPRLQSILVGVARALAHCHEREIYHRDIKPENILVETRSHAGILADFGLARSANLTNITRTRQMLGTLRYMSPELMHGADVGAESDIYQMGLVAFEMFAGQLPLEAESPQQSAIRRMSEEIPSPKGFHPVISTELANLILWSLMVDPKQRPPNMETFADALEGLDPVDAEAAARLVPVGTGGSSPRIGARSVSIPNLSRPGDATIVGAPDALPTARSASSPPTPPSRSSSRPGGPPASASSPDQSAPVAPTSRPPLPGGPVSPASRTGRSGPNLGSRTKSGSFSADRLNTSRQISQSVIFAELRARDRNKKLLWGGLALTLVLGISLFVWSLSPHGFAVRPGFEDAVVVARGPAFQVEVHENGALRSTVKPHQEADGTWKATIGGLHQAHPYSVCWVTESGRRGSLLAFDTREVKISEVSHQLKDTGVEIAFKTSLPMRAAALLRGTDSSVDLDTALATDHQGILPLSRMRATELVVELKDAGGAVARVPIGEITSPLALARRLDLAVNRIDMDSAFMRIHGSVRGISRVANMLADDFRQGPYREVLQVLEEFRPASAAYFDDPDVDLSARIHMYDTLTKLTGLSALLKAEAIPLEFPVETMLGTTFAITSEDQLPGAEPIRMAPRRGVIKLRRDISREFVSAGKGAAELSNTLGLKRDDEDHDFSVKLTGVAQISRAQLTLRVRYLQPLSTGTVSVNDKMRLYYHCPGHQGIDSKRAVSIHHAFDPRLLVEGENKFRLHVGTVSKLEFGPLETEGLVLKVERRK